MLQEWAKNRNKAISVGEIRIQMVTLITCIKGVDWNAGREEYKNKEEVIRKCKDTYF